MGQTRFTGPVVSDNGFVGPFNGVVPNNLTVANDGSIGGDLDVTGEVTSTAGFVGDITGNVTGDTTGTHTGPTIVQAVAFADLSELTATAGSVAFVTDASPAAALVFYDGSNWIDVLTGSTVTDT